ncbi:aspartyl protease family protein [Caulobacter sp. RL271]|jgi:predicted aspartyl protease/tetratricopeptide (TPR) repeat protein|uniref:Aspartyl protease family protein n=1 Tax=Caulobacter segnis TaxID=88688 RepID=A0ABY4ZVC8_9CAUL|nr:aspartyl protease family protein [Caulobacter segnis]USQ96691.1 aspartyl protease family protein [Caulobacter segnis]
MFSALRVSGLALALAFLSSQTLAASKCQVMKLAELPVTMEGLSPVTTGQINGREARFIVDSGAFHSTMSAGAAQELGLSVGSLGVNARLKGVGGETSLGVTTAKEFVIAGQKLPRVEFAVGGSSTRYAGLLGQNILGIAGVEYDLGHGAVRIMKTKDCGDVSLTYWAGDKPFTLMRIEPMENGDRHTLATVEVNGVKLKAMFDTGASSSVLSLDAAKRLGVNPDKDGLPLEGFSWGVGQKRVRTWKARFDKIDIGGEVISKPWLQIFDGALGDADMLIGVDFFLSHRVFVDNQNHRMFFTYEGGPLFGISPKGAVDKAGKTVDLTDKTAEPTDAPGYARRGAVLASNGKFDAAIADFDKAVALAPNDADYLLQRARAHLSNRQLLLGAADLDKSVALDPKDAEARLTRAQLRRGSRDPAGALDDLKAADENLAPSAQPRLRLARLYSALDAPEQALTNYDLWLKSHPEDVGRAEALNGRCWARALLNRELDKAMSDCDAALRLHPGDPAFLDSRALVRFRRGELEKALVDYDAAVKGSPREAWSLYARGLVERRLGKVAEADADKAKALAINPDVAARIKRYQLDG